MKQFGKSTGAFKGVKAYATAKDVITIAKHATPLFGFDYFEFQNTNETDDKLNDQKQNLLNNSKGKIP